MTTARSLPPPEAEHRDAFRKRHSQNGDCWEWTGYRNSKGYGVFRFHRSQRLAHRLSYEWTFGEIPAGLLVLHKCDNPPCVNPAHLYAGTAGQNAIDRDTRGRGYLIRGELSPLHILTEDQVLEIRRDYSPRVVTLRMLAARYGVKFSTIGAVILRKSWKHVSENGGQS